MYHCSAPSLVRQMVAVKCSQTSGGISSPGYKLNNGRPCPPCLGPKITHTHTHRPRHPPFSTHYVRPQRERVQCRARCQPVEWQSIQCGNAGQGSCDVFSCNLIIETPWENRGGKGCSEHKKGFTGKDINVKSQINDRKCLKKMLFVYLHKFFWHEHVQGKRGTANA